MMRDRNNDPVRIVTTMWQENDPHWMAETELVDRRAAGMLRHTVRLVRQARRADVVVVVGAIGARERYIDQIGAIAIRLLARPRPAVVVTDATWEPDSKALAARAPWASRLLPSVARSIIRLMDHPRVIYCVLSTAELERFPITWHIDPNRVVFTPWHVTAAPPAGRVVEGDYLFAGGDSLRDYGILLDAVTGMDIPVRVATRHEFDYVPPNVIYGPTSHEDFMSLLAGCRLSVVPLVDSVRSAGQQTYLNAMYAGKLTIVTDAPGVRDYIDHGVSGLICEPNPGSMRAAIEWAIDPVNAEKAKKIAERGREIAVGFTRERYNAKIIDIARMAADRA
jgi:glycosyltransferase involved in cell wall biosynthesis